MARIAVAKIDAARRQLEAAVLLYFNDRDPLAIHTLAAAAQGVLETLAARAGKSTPLLESLHAQLPPELVESLRKAIRGPQNFLKHSDRDPNATLDFEPDLTEMLLYDAAASYFRITGEQVPMLSAFVLWYAINHPDWFPGVDKELQANLHLGRKLIVADGRSAFLETFFARNARLRGLTSN